FVDSHTEGEPTRIIVAGGPDLGGGSVAERRDRLAREHDDLRRLVIGPPRGAAELVGGLRLPAERSGAHAVVFFNNVGYLGMCGHGTIGLLVTLAYLGEIPPMGTQVVETAVGPVSATLHGPNDVSVTNVPSYRYRAKVPVEVPGYGTVVGDIAWGGNWFFLVDVGSRRLQTEEIPALLEHTKAIRRALTAHGITGERGEEIDHIELFGPPERADADSRNFVLCPGGEYDRSPCGTGTSAKVACLHADGLLEEGASWRQESILGTQFEARYERVGRSIVPQIRGRAYITADGELIADASDPLRPGRA
ncbi:MAG: proline racemase family protein, partial [Thermoplasmata archaeon]